VKYGDEVREKARGMRSMGASVPEIALAVGASTTAVLRWIDPVYAEKQDAAVRAWREAHPGCVAKWSKNQRVEHPERTRAATKRYADEHKKEASARARAHYERNREALLARSQERRAADPEGWRAYQEQYRRENPDKVRAAIRRWNNAHPESGRAHVAKRRAQKAEALSAMTDKEREAIMRVYAAAANVRRVRCYLCGEWIPMGGRHVDHIVPLSKGGKHMAANLAVACAYCNLSKGAKMPDEVGVLV
jgi:5-methylcytosine-specific restriction endonuclease McrA